MLTTAPHVWTNVVLALDHYLITFHRNVGICPNPMDAREIALQRASPEDELLMPYRMAVVNRPVRAFHA